MRIATTARPHGGLDLSCEATVRIDIIAAHYHVAAGSATDDSGSKVDL